MPSEMDDSSTFECDFAMQRGDARCPLPSKMKIGSIARFLPTGPNDRSDGALLSLPLRIAGRYRTVVVWQN